MESTPRIQTAFRFTPELLGRIKREAERRHQSVNAFVEAVLDRETRLEFPIIPKDFKVSEELRALTGFVKTDPRYLSDDTQEQLDLDEKARMDYLCEKYGIK